ncbi:alpha/beta fold hydrolase [Microcoleus sp. FACHB-1515]|uniref:alpha/beta fold hydrolase n=1 Tax=Cyanophyceae TaxID=3028117 RepID=UPI0016874B0A|nr:alpha/beta fold hydrolase [Microcoleus sp. FACHB-1515]MBD2092696.1 alpha/beta fold hydrolase [Microcoleus sp. FACHB-1515]
MNRQRLGLILVAIVLIVASWLGIASARSGLIIKSLDRESLPLLYVAPRVSPAPGVLVAHGFAGSKQLMLGYAHVLAKAGYAVMLWDFNGHGANPVRLERYELQNNLATALQVLQEQPEVDRAQLALLGHSMGSGIVMTAGVQDAAQFAATIAISPTGAAVTPTAPRNLQLQVGSGEGRFIQNADRLLTQAGDENSSLAAGTARELIVIPNAQHITILFSDVSHQAAVRWLDATFNRTSESQYVDRRIGWYGLHLLGWLLGLTAIAPIAATPLPALKINPLQRWAGLLVAPIAAISAATLLNQRIELASLGGVQVGGAVGVWLLIAGITWLTVLAQVSRPTGRSVAIGLALFAILWIAFGAMAQVVWLQWWLIPSRLKVWLPIAAACFPWFLAAGMVQQSIGTGKRILWWLAQSAILILGFGATVYLIPQLGFMFLLLPLFPPILGLLAIVAGWLNDAWAYAIGSALFFAWLLAAGFPLS